VSVSEETFQKYLSSHRWEVWFDKQQTRINRSSFSDKCQKTWWWSQSIFYISYFNFLGRYNCPQTFLYVYEVAATWIHHHPSRGKVLFGFEAALQITLPVHINYNTKIQQAQLHIHTLCSIQYKFSNPTKLHANRGRPYYFCN